MGEVLAKDRIPISDKEDSDIMHISDNILYIRSKKECSEIDVERLISQALRQVQICPTAGLDCIHLAEHIDIRRENLELVKGLCLYQLGKREEAEAAFNRELAHYPYNRNVAEIKKTLNESN